MLRATKDIILPTTITGSLPRPSWYTQNLGARSFLDASWRSEATGLPGLDRAVERILAARDRHELVVVWGDYDCDEAGDCWWATDTRGRKYGFVVESVPATAAA